MDITLVDVTDVSAAAPGDAVVIFGQRAAIPPEREGAFYGTLAAAVGAVAVPGSISRGRGKPDILRAPTVEETAAWAATIPHEILSRIGARVPRVYVDPAQREVSR